MKKFNLSILILSITFLGTIWQSCSTDSETNEVEEQKEGGYEKISKKAAVATQDSILLVFCLLNETGDTVTTFSEGEDIIFDLTVINESHRHIHFDYTTLFTSELFRIYSSGGEDMGRSWNYQEDQLSVMEYLYPTSSRHWACPWYGTSKTEASYPMTLKGNSPSLPVGDYYVKAVIQTSKECILTCRIDFEIK